MEYEYNAVKECELCKKSFGITRTRHKCKRCRLVICADCGKSKSVIIGTKDTTPHRICNLCNNDVQFQKDFRTKFDVSWGKTSRLAHDWLINYIEDGGVDPKEEYPKLLEESKQSEYLPTQKEIQKDLRQGRGDKETFNISLMEFIHYAQNGLDREIARRSIENVLKAFYVKIKIEHCNALIIVTTILLCLADERTAFGLLCYLHEKLVPEDYWNKFGMGMPYAGLVKQRYLLKKIIDERVKFDNDVFKDNFNIAYKKGIDAFLGTLLIHGLNASSLMYIWHEMFDQRSFRVIQEATVLALIKAKPFLEKHSNISIKNFQLWLCRNLTEKHFKNEKVGIDSEIEQYTQDIEDFEFETIKEKRDKVQFALNTLKSMNKSHYKALYAEVNRIANMNKLKSKSKAPPGPVEITKEDFIPLIRDKLGYTEFETDIEYEEFFGGLDLYDREKIDANTFLGILLISISEGDMEPKFSEFFKFKSPNGKPLDANGTKELLDALEEIIGIIVELEANLLYRQELLELQEKAKRKVKDQKTISARELFLITCTSSLIDLLVEKRRTLSMIESDAKLYSSFRKSARSSLAKESMIENMLMKHFSMELGNSPEDSALKDVDSEDEDNNDDDLKLNGGPPAQGIVRAKSRAQTEFKQTTKPIEEEDDETQPKV